MSFRSFAFVAAVAIGLGWLCIAWYTRQPEQLVGRLEQELVAADDGQIEGPLRSLAAIGEPALPALACALASDRATERQVARRVLIEEVDRWELLPADAVETRLAALARSLAASAPKMDIENRRVASDLAMRLILWPRAGGSASCPWLTDCEAVLASAAERKPQPTQVAAIQLVAKAGFASPEAQQSLAPTEFADSGASLPEKAELPGGELPLDMSPMPDVRGFVEPHIVHAAAPPQADPRQPGRLEIPSDSRSLDGEESDTSDNDDGDDLSNGGTPAAGANHPARLPSASRGARRMAAGLQAGRQAVATTHDAEPVVWEKLDSRDVMRRLHASDERVASAARLELERRGISGTLVNVARRATDPDPQVRRALAEALPSMPGVEAKPWLLQLSYDEDLQVRHSAVTLMATSGDLEMVRRLEEISRDDPDESIRGEAAKAVRPATRRGGP
jgi:hypothetical protein